MKIDTAIMESLGYRGYISVDDLYHRVRLAAKSTMNHETWNRHFRKFKANHSDKIQEKEFKNKQGINYKKFRLAKGSK